MISYIYQRKRRDADGNSVKSKTWHARYRAEPHENIRDWSLNTRDQRVAQQRLDAFVKRDQDERAGIVPPAAVIEAANRPIREHVAEFLAELRTVGRSHDYVRVMDTRLHRLIDECGWHRPADLTAAKFSAWRREASHLAPRTLNHFLQYARRFFNYLVKRGIVQSNPLDGIDKVDQRGKQTIERRALSHLEQRALLQTSGPNAPVYLVALTTGFRRAELAALVWADVHLDATTPHLRLPASATKNRTEALQPIPPGTVSALRAIRPADASPTTRVFPRMPSDRQVNRDFAAAGIAKRDAFGRTVDLHALRHTFDTNLLRSDVPPFIAQRLMRHSDIRLTTRVYADDSQLPTAHALSKLPSLSLDDLLPPGQDPQCSQKRSQPVVPASPRVSQPDTPPDLEDWPEVLDNQAFRHKLTCPGTPSQYPNEKRCGRDSNPRDPCGSNAFQVRRLQPLGHRTGAASTGDGFAPRFAGDCASW